MFWVFAGTPWSPCLRVSVAEYDEETFNHGDMENTEMVPTTENMTLHTFADRCIDQSSCDARGSACWSGRDTIH